MVTEGLCPIFEFMSNLPEQTRELLQILRDPRANERAINRAAQAWMKALETPESLQQILDAQRELASAIEWENLERAQLALTLSGALVEQGFAPEPLLDAFAPHLPAWLEGANRLLLSAGTNEDGDLDEAAFDAAAEQMPDERLAWNRLEAFHLPLIAALSHSPEARAQLRPLVPLVRPLVPYSSAAHFLWPMLEILDEEPILVLEPSRKRGFIGTISGIADNFQLHALLMAHYPEVRPISPAAIAIFRGKGPQTNGETIVGAWNLYNYRALSQGLPEGLGDTETWIWGEGQPKDIEKFAGYRAIVLGEPAYERSWQVQRLFSGLRAELEVERELSAEEVEDWVKRLANAN